MLIIILCVALFLGHFVKGITGFGSALVSIPILSMVFPPTTAIAISLICDLCIGAYLSWTVRHQVVWSIVWVMLLGAVGGQWCGLVLQKELNPNVVRICMAVVITLFSLRILLGSNPEAARFHKWPYLAGIFSGYCAGIMGGLVGASGPPVVFFTTSYYDKVQGRSILLVFFFFSAITLIGGMVQQDLISSDVFSYAGVGVVVALLAARLGARVMPHVSQVHFMRGVAALLLTSALSMVFVVVYGNGMI